MTPYDSVLVNITVKKFHDDEHQHSSAAMGGPSEPRQVETPRAASQPTSAINEDGIEEEQLTGPQINVAEREDVPPEGGYGWIVTACVFLINAHTWGVNAAWGVFLAHFLSESTFRHATHLQYALIGGLSISQALLVSPLVAMTNEKLGTRVSLLFGTVLVSVSMLASSFATHRDLASVPEPGCLLRVRPGLPIHHCFRCPPTVVLPTTEPSCWACIIWSWNWRSRIQPRSRGRPC